MWALMIQLMTLTADQEACWVAEVELGTKG